jgi:hypothetical protein
MLRISTVLASLIAAACGSEPTVPPIPDSPKATTVRVLSGAGQATLPGLWLPASLIIQVLDQEGLPFPSAPIALNPSGDGETVQDTPVSGIDGRVTVTWRLGKYLGPQTVEVTVGGIPEAVSVMAQAVPMAPVDLVRVTGAPPDLYGLLGSGTTPFGNVNDYRRTSSLTESDAGDFHALSGSGRSELVFFTRGAPPRLILDPWTDGPDVIEASFADPLVVPITVWIMEVPFDETLERFMRDADYTEGVYADEGLGIVFDLEVVDATTTENIEGFMTFDCSKSTATEQTVGHHDDRLNLYYVSTVDGGSERGVTFPRAGARLQRSRIAPGFSQRSIARVALYSSGRR